jgi:hypothetical protein
MTANMPYFKNRSKSNSFKLFIAPEQRSPDHQKIELCIGFKISKGYQRKKLLLVVGPINAVGRRY